MDYRMMGKLFLLCYLKLFCLVQISSKCFVFNQKHPLLASFRKAKEQSGYVGREDLGGEYKMGTKSCYARRRGETR